MCIIFPCICSLILIDVHWFVTGDHHVFVWSSLNSIKVSLVLPGPLLFSLVFIGLLSMFLYLLSMFNDLHWCSLSCIFSIYIYIYIYIYVVYCHSFVHLLSLDFRLFSLTFIYCFTDFPMIVVDIHICSSMFIGCPLFVYGCSLMFIGSSICFYLCLLTVIDFQRFSYMFIDLCWCSLMYIDVQRISVADHQLSPISHILCEAGCEVAIVFLIAFRK